MTAGAYLDGIWLLLWAAVVVAGCGRVVRVAEGTT